MSRNFWVVKAVIFTVVVAGVYSPTFYAGFIWDDDVFFARNPLMSAPDALRRFWMSTDAPDYFPLVSTVLWVQRQLWGLDPLGYHLVNIVFHAFNGILFWRILSLLALPGAWFAALLFALHPIQVESVSWVTQIKNVQSAFFYLLALFCYLRGDLITRDRKNYFLSLFLFLLALLSKTSVTMLPVILVLYHWWKGGHSPKTVFLRTSPFFVLSLTLAMVTIWFQYQSAGAKGPEFSLSFLDRSINAGHVVWFYFLKLLLPINLMFVYPRWSVNTGDWVSYLSTGCMILMISLFFFKRRVWGRSLIFGLGYYVASLFPVMGFFNIYFMRYSFVADHWQYIAGQGVIALAVGSLFSCAQRLLGENGVIKTDKVFAGVGLSILIGVLVLLTWNQQAIYQNNITLWQDTLKKNPQAWIAHNNLGNELELLNNFKQAEKHYRETLRIKPDYAEAEDNLGLVLLKMGQTTKSKNHFLKAIQLKPDLWEAHNNLGTLLAREGQNEEALWHFETVLGLDSENSRAHNNLGLIFEQLGRPNKALMHYYKALRDPKIQREIHNNIGALLLGMGRREKAAFHFRKALDIDPNFKPALLNLELAKPTQP